MLPLAPRRRLYRVIGNLLFLASVIALTYVGFTLIEARLYQDAAIEALGNQTHSAAIAGTYQQKPLLKEGDVLGRMDIARLGLSVAILQGTSPRVLRLGAGHIAGTAFPGEAGNSGVAGHRDTFFRGLKDVRKDDDIELQTATSLVRYKVDWVRVVEPDDTGVLASSTDESTLTLVTCYPFYMVGPAPKRFVVHARKS